MLGKQKCRILREIRKEIAKNNDIEYVTAECTFKGNCRGTCPKCESEVLYLEKELEKRRNLGKNVTLAGISAVMTLAAACNNNVAPESNTTPTEIATPTASSTELINGEIVLDGDIAFTPEPTDDLYGLAGEINDYYSTEPPTEIPMPLPGDVAW